MAASMIALILIIIGILGFLLDLVISLFDKAESTLLCLAFDCDTVPIPSIIILFCWAAVTGFGFFLFHYREKPSPSSRRSMPPSSRRSMS